jgi:hypothetical protein
VKIPIEVSRDEDNWAPKDLAQHIADEISGLVSSAAERIVKELRSKPVIFPNTTPLCKVVVNQDRKAPFPNVEIYPIVAWQMGPVYHEARPIVPFSTDENIEGEEYLLDPASGRWLSYGETGDGGEGGIITNFRRRFESMKTFTESEQEQAI